MSRGLPFAVLALAVLAGCGRGPEPQAGATAGPEPAGAAGNAFDVHVTLSDAAAAQLAASAAAVVVSAVYFGYPTVAAQQRQLPNTRDPWLELHRHEVALAGAGSARFPSVAFDDGDLALVEGGVPQVSIGVRADGAAAEDALDCGMFQDTLAAAALAPVEIDCRLAVE